jgi:hypothetical protein
VLVQVRAAGLSRGTWHLMIGKPYLMRLMGFPLSVNGYPLSAAHRRAIPAP